MFRVYAKPNGAVDARIGIVVSRRVIPQATARNYCKRLAREVFRTERETLAGVDLVVRVQAAVPRGLSGTARAEIRDLLQRAQRQCRGTATLSR